MASTIYETLKAEIRSGQLSSDTPLREVELAERFGVSRTPIREALHRLSSEKLIRTLPNAGAFVGMFTWEDAREIFAIRQVLEAFAAGLTAQFIPRVPSSTCKTCWRRCLMPCRRAPSRPTPSWSRNSTPF
jgi:DNA-binding GntR family transcriptional regulator